MATQVEVLVALVAEGIEDDGEKALSLSDFPMEDAGDSKDADPCPAGEAAASPEFEFLTTRGSFGGGSSSKLEETDMCAADEVFFQGQILPLRPSVSSDCGGGGGGFFHHSRCGSRSESMDRSSVGGSLGFDSRSSSTGRSTSSSGTCSASISRSHSTHSSASGDSTAARVSISSNFYTHPSPKPHLPSKNRHTPRRKSLSSSTTGTGGAGWGIFRAGLVRGPEIELLQDPRHRRTPSVSSRSAGSSKRFDGAETKAEKVMAETTTKDNGNRKSQKKGSGGKGKLESLIMRLFKSRFGCKRSPDDAVVPISSSSSSSKISGDKRRDQHGSASRRRPGRVEERCHSSRTFQWLEQLSVEKVAVL